MRKIRQIYYRGSLRFCNYSCSYCPFSKNKGSNRQLAQDRAELFRFVDFIGQDTFHGAVQIVPYGEALIHEYYWEGLAKLSMYSAIQAVGAQSNFSFPVERMLSVYEAFGGNKEKLRLWGTFHPEMTTPEQFLAQCDSLQKAQILFCVGAVGVPKNLELLRWLRAGLNQSVYFWINKMDGLGRRYTEEEVKAFLELDKYFALELRHFKADKAACAEAVFIQGDGKIRPCNLCSSEMGNLYQDGLEELPQKICTRKECDCFLSYGSRMDAEELQVFKPYPAFRIPVWDKSVICMGMVEHDKYFTM